MQIIYIYKYLFLCDRFQNDQLETKHLHIQGAEANYRFKHRRSAHPIKQGHADAN